MDDRPILSQMDMDDLWHMSERQLAVRKLQRFYQARHCICHENGHLWFGIPGGWRDLAGVTVMSKLPKEPLH